MKDGRRFGGPPKPYTPPATPTGKINTTDLDSRNVKTQGGWVQGYNVQAAANQHQIVLAAEISVSSPDFGHLEPMVEATRRELAAIGIHDRPGVIVADAGYWHQQQMERVIDLGIPVLMPPDAGNRTRENPRPNWNGGLYAFMRRLLASDYGHALYRQRKIIIEPLFGDLKFNRGFVRFLRRGRAAARSELRLMMATSNLNKLYRHHLLTITATAGA